MSNELTITPPNVTKYVTALALAIRSGPEDVLVKLVPLSSPHFLFYYESTFWIMELINFLDGTSLLDIGLEGN